MRHSIIGERGEIDKQRGLVLAVRSSPLIGLVFCFLKLFGVHLSFEPIQSLLTFFVAAMKRQQQPFVSRDKILLYSSPVAVQSSEVVLSLEISLLGSLLISVDRVGKTLRYPYAGLEKNG